MKLRLFCCLLLCGLSLAPIHGEEPHAAGGAPDSKEVAVLKTSAGTMVVKFWPEKAPRTVENFKKLARAGFYDGTLFHRIIRGFMIQGGDALTKDPTKEALWGQGAPPQSVPDEFNDRPHLRGVISMAHTDKPNSGGSQFFICLGNASQLNHKFAAFGKVTKGLDVLDQIGRTPVTRAPDGELSKPTERVVLESVKIVAADAAN